MKKQWIACIGLLLTSCPENGSMALQLDQGESICADYHDQIIAGIEDGLIVAQSSLPSLIKIQSGGFTEKCPSLLGTGAGIKVGVGEIVLSNLGVSDSTTTLTCSPVQGEISLNIASPRPSDGIIITLPWSLQCASINQSGDITMKIVLPISVVADIPIVIQTSDAGPTATANFKEKEISIKEESISFEVTGQSGLIAGALKKILNSNKAKVIAAVQPAFAGAFTGTKIKLSLSTTHENEIDVSIDLPFGGGHKDYHLSL